MKIQDLKSVISRSLTQAAIAAVIVYYSSKIEKHPDAVATAMVIGVMSGGVPLDLIPAIVETDERGIVESILATAVAGFLAKCQASDETIELARDMIAVNMTEGLLADFDLAGAVRRAVQKRELGQ